MHGRNAVVDFTARGYDCLRVIGSGQFGRAHLVRRLADGELRAAKMVDLTNLDTSDALAAGNEPQVLQLLDNCPSIVRLYEHFVHQGYLTIIMEYCQGGDLARCLNSMRTMGKKFPEAEIIVMLRQILEALVHMHDSFVMHRDLKPSNILIGGDGHLKLADFGVSRNFNHTFERALTTVGTPQYMPPEIVMGLSYGNKGDMWSLGCVLYEMVTLCPAFEAAHPWKMCMQICNPRPRPIGPEWSKSLKMIIDSLLAKEPERRPFPHQLLQHPYLNMMPDPGSQHLAWGDGLILEERDEDEPPEEEPEGRGADDPLGNIVPPDVGGLPSQFEIEGCEIIFWRFVKAIRRANTSILQTLLSSNPKVWTRLIQLFESTDYIARTQETGPEHVLEQLLMSQSNFCNNGTLRGGLLSAPGLMNTAVWEETMTDEWLLSASSKQQAGLSKEECMRVLVHIQSVTGEMKVTLRCFYRFSRVGELTARYLNALQNSAGESNNEAITREVTASIERMYSTLCNRIYGARMSSGTGQEALQVELIDGSEGGVSKELVELQFESNQCEMSKDDVIAFLRFASKSPDGMILMRRTTTEMLQHSALPAAVERRSLPKASTKLGLLTSAPEPPSERPADPSQAQASPDSGGSTSPTSSRQSTRIHRSPSIVHSELMSEGLSEAPSGTGSGHPSLRSMGGSADFSSGGGLCRGSRLPRPIRSETSAPHAHLDGFSPPSCGRRPRADSGSSDRVSIYSDANPEVGIMSPSDRSEITGLHRHSTLPVWTDKLSHASSRYVSPRAPKINVSQQRRAARRPLPGSSAPQRTRSSPRPSNNRKRVPFSRPRLNGRAPLGSSSGLRTISSQEARRIPTYNRDLAGSITGTNLTYVFVSPPCHVEPESRCPSRFLESLMTEALLLHERCIELLLSYYHTMPLTSERCFGQLSLQLTEALRSPVEGLKNRFDKLNEAAPTISENRSLYHEFAKILCNAFRLHTGTKEELERLSNKLSCSERGMVNRRNGCRGLAMSPASSGSSIERLMSWYDKARGCVIVASIDLGNHTQKLSEVMRGLRQGCEVLSREVRPLTRERHRLMTRLRDNHSRSQNYPLSTSDITGSRDKSRDSDTVRCLNLCVQIKRALSGLEKKRRSDSPEDSISIWRNHQHCSSFPEERLQRHQSQISPRQRESRRDMLVRESSQVISRSTTDFGKNYREWHGRMPLASSFVPPDDFSYSRRRIDTPSDESLIDERNPWSLDPLHDDPQRTAYFDHLGRH